MGWQISLEASPFGVGTPVRVKDSPIREQVSRAGAVQAGSNGKVRVLLQDDVLCSLFQPDQLELLTAAENSKTDAMLAALRQQFSPSELEELWGRLGCVLGGGFATASKRVFRPLTDGKNPSTSQPGQSSRHFAATGWIKHGQDKKQTKNGLQDYAYVAYAWKQNGKERSKRFPKHLEAEVSTLIEKGKVRSDAATVVHEILQFINCEPKPKKQKQVRKTHD